MAEKDLIIRVRADGTAQVSRDIGRLNQSITGTGTSAGTAGIKFTNSAAAAKNMGAMMGQSSRSARATSTSLGGTAAAAAAAARNTTQVSNTSVSAGRSLGQLATTARSTSSSFSGLISRSTLVVAGIAGIGLGVKSAVTSFVDFDSTMRRTGAIMGATDAQMVSMRDIAKELGSTTKFSAGQAAEALQFLGMAGLSAEQSMIALPGTLDLAAAGAIDLGTAADIATNILGQYGKTAEDLTEVNDILARTFTTSNTNLRELGEAASYSAGTAKAANQDFVTFNATLGLLADVGVKGSMAGTSLGQAFGRLLDPVGLATRKLEDAGVAVRDADGNIRQFTDILADMSEVSGGAALAIDVFGQLAGAKLVPLINNGRAAIEAKVETLQKYEGTAKTVASALEGSLGGALTNLGSAAEGAAIELIEMAEGAFVSIIEGTTTVVRATSQLIGSVATPWNKVFARITTNAATTFSGLVRIVSSGVLDMTGEFRLLPASWTAVLASMPRALEATVQTMVLGLIGFVLKARNAWSELVVASARVWNAIRAQTLTIMAGLEEAVVNAYRAIINSIGRMVQAAGSSLIGLARTTSNVSESMARSIEDTSISMQKLGRDMQTTEGHTSGLRGSIGDLEQQNASLVQSNQAVNQEYGRQIAIVQEMVRENWEEVDAIQAGVDGRGEVIEAIDREAQSREAINTVLTETIEALDDTSESLDKSGEASGRAGKAAEDLAEKVKKTEESTKDLAKTTEKETDFIAESWKTLNNNIQNLFSSTFKDLFTGAFDGWKGLLNSMWGLFAEFASNIAAQRIMVSLGMTGAGGAANAAGGIGGIGGGISSGLGSVFGGLFSGIGGMLSGGGAGFGFGMASTGATMASQGLLGGGLAALSNAGSLASTGSLMAAAGAALPVLLPIAGAILAFGGLLKSTPPRAYVVGDVATGDITQLVEKKGQDATALVNLFDQIIETGQGFVSELGGSLAGGELDLHINPDRLRFTFRLGEGDIELDVDPEDNAAVADAVAKMVLAAASQADFSEAESAVGEFLNTFTLSIINGLPTGEAEQYVQALSIIGAALDTGPLELYEAAVKESTKTLLGSITYQSNEIQRLAREFDGSSASAASMAQGLTTFRSSAVAAFIAIEQVQQSVSASIANLRTEIETSLMSQGEKVSFWLGEAERIQEELVQATDPAVIQQLTNELTGALSNAWQNMDEDRRNEEKDWILGLLNDTELTVGDTLDRAAANVLKLWNQASASVENALRVGAESIRSAASALQAAIPSQIHVTTSATVTVNTNSNSQPTAQPIGNKVPGTGKQRGGWVSGPGGGHDTIPIMVGANEAVITRHQQAMIEPALKSMYGFGLGALFNSVNTPHSASGDSGTFPGFQQGGFVSVQGGHLQQDLAGELARLRLTLDRVLQENPTAIRRIERGIDAVLNRVARNFDQAANSIPATIRVKVDQSNSGSPQV